MQDRAAEDGLNVQACQLNAAESNRPRPGVQSVADPARDPVHRPQEHAA